MARQDILLIGVDHNSLRILEVSLRKSGFMVASVSSFSDALEKLKIAQPDLIIIDSYRDPESFEFATKLKSDYRSIPVIFISSNKEINTRIRALEIGIDDYLIKPIYIREIIARTKIHLHKRERDRIEEGITAGFIGSLSDVGLHDIVQTVDVNRKSGILEIKGKTQEGRIYFKNGQIVQANIGKYRGEYAIYHMLTLNEGIFKMSFLDIDIQPEIDKPNNILIMEGMRRLDEYMKYTEQLPQLTTRLDVDEDVLRQKLLEIPDNVDKVLKLINSERSINEIIELSDLDELESLKIISALYFDGIVYDVFVRRPEDKKRPDSTLPEPLYTSIKSEILTSSINTDRPIASPAWAESVFKEENIMDGRSNLSDSPSIADEGQNTKKEEAISVKDTGLIYENNNLPDDRIRLYREEPSLQTDKGEVDTSSKSRYEGVISQDDTQQTTRERVIEKTLIDNVTLSTSSYVKGSLLGRKKVVVKNKRDRLPLVWIFIVLVLFIGGGFVVFNLVYKKDNLSRVIMISQLKKEDEKKRYQMEEIRWTKEEKVELDIEKKMEERERGPEGERMEAEKEVIKEEMPIREEGAEGEGNKVVDRQLSGAHRSEHKHKKDDIQIDIEGYKKFLSAAQTLYQNGRSNQAKKELKQALIRNPTGYEAFTLLGQIDLEANKIRSAITYFKRAISYNNKYAPAYFYLGTSYQLNGNNIVAKKMYERYLKLAPTGEFSQDVRAILSDLK